MTADANPTSIDRLHDLLAVRATAGLTTAEESELSTLLARWPHVAPDDFDRAAAAVHLTAVHRPLPLPPGLKAKLETDAIRHFGPPAEPHPPAAGPARRRSTAFYWAACGWTCAATVLVGFLAIVLTQKPREVIREVVKSPAEPTVTEKRDKLKADLTAKTFASAATPDAPTGTVVFSPSKQEGYMELKGLKPNDPTKTQYQLWVVDKGRPHAEPVDGGVFDVRADGTALVPVKSPLVLREVAAFAVTVEAAGGVVVSEAGKKGDFVVVMTPGGP
jgi:hypothetical protein